MAPAWLPEYKLASRGCGSGGAGVENGWRSGLEGHFCASLGTWPLVPFPVALPPGPQATLSWGCAQICRFSSSVCTRLEPRNWGEAERRAGSGVRDRCCQHVTLTSGPRLRGLLPLHSPQSLGRQQAGPHHVVDEVGEGP
ncbi:unnamed protein product, partial [Gulo gulo]